jgi:hypothetical protein
VSGLDGLGANASWNFQNSIGDINFQNSGNINMNGGGNVGIGTSSPGSLLDVSGDIAGGNFIARSGVTALTYGMSGGSNGMQVFSSTNHVQFNTNSSERMRIDSSGNVGIGTTSPGALLDVGGEMRAYAENNALVNGTLADATHLKGAINGLNGNVTVPTATAGANGVLCGDGTARTITRGTGLTMYVNGSNVASATLAARGVASVLFTTASVCYVSGDVS